MVVDRAEEVPALAERIGHEDVGVLPSILDEPSTPGAAVSMLAPMRAIVAVVVVLGLVGCGGKGGDQDAFCAAGADYTAAPDDGARASAVEAMLADAPKKLKDSVESLRDLSPTTDGYEAARDEVASFLDENCDTATTTAP